MAEFLSEAWVGELAEAASGHPGLAGLDAGEEIVIDQVIESGPGVERLRYHVTISAEGVAVELGAHRTANITMTQDHATAWAIATGAESAQRAFMSGRLKISGDTSRALANREALTALGDVFSAVRERTTPARPTGDGRSDDA